MILLYPIWLLLALPLAVSLFVWKPHTKLVLLLRITISLGARGDCGAE
jgi:hypothetical protein